NLPPGRNQRQHWLYRVGHDVSADHYGLAVRNLIRHVTGEKLGKRSHTLGDALDDAKLRRSGAERCQKSGQDPVRRFAGRVVEKRGQAENVYIAGGGLGTRWGRSIHSEKARP